MPPRTRKAPAKKKAAASAVVEPAVEETPVTEPTPESTPEVEVEAEETEAPKSKGGRKRSELAHAAREFEKWAKVTTLLEQRYAKQAEKLSDTAADLEKAREHRDESKGKLDNALNGASDSA